MKKGYIILVLFILLASYLFWTDFGLVKYLIGHNVPETGLSITEPDMDDNKSCLGFLNVPDRFKISIIAKDLEGPRVILFDSKGRMLISETKAGRVSIL